MALTGYRTFLRRHFSLQRGSVWQSAACADFRQGIVSWQPQFDRLETIIAHAGAWFKRGIERRY